MDVDEFAIDLVGAAGGFVGFVFLQFGGEFGLAPLEFLNQI